MDFNGIFGTDQECKLVRGYREEERSAAKLVGETPMQLQRHVAVDFLPGFCPTSTTRKADDSNLSPFDISNPKTIQYGDTSIMSISTDDPRWSAGECKFLYKYEGQFRRQLHIMNSKVKFDFCSYNLICHLLGSK